MSTINSADCFSVSISISVATVNYEIHHNDSENIVAHDKLQHKGTFSSCCSLVPGNI